MHGKWKKNIEFNHLHSLHSLIRTKNFVNWEGTQSGNVTGYTLLQNAAVRSGNVTGYTLLQNAAVRTISK